MKYIGQISKGQFIRLNEESDESGVLEEKRGREVRENERQARSINHTFVGITLVYAAASARSKGSFGSLSPPCESADPQLAPV